MSIFSRFLLSTAIVGLMPALPAVAADLDLPVFVEEAPELVPVEIGSGWYLRGDISYAVTNNADAPNYRTFDLTTAAYTSGTYANSDLEARLGVGVGIGYQFNRWLRADVTGERFQGSFSGTTSGNPPCINPAVNIAYAGTSCSSQDSANFVAWSAMANGYVDLGTYFGITPYVGAGAGLTWLNWEPLSSSTYCVGGTCPTSLVATNTYPGQSDARFTYAFMGGAAVKVSKNMKIDVGYKYRRIAGGPMANWNAASTTAGATGTQSTDNGLTTHEVRVGLRYEIW